MLRLGLRGRVAISLVLTAAVALGVAALALLSPLERKLRDQELRDVVSIAVQSRSSFSEIDTSRPQVLKAKLTARVRKIAGRTGARVALLDNAHHVLVTTDPDEPDRFLDARAALHTDRPVRRIVTRRGVPEARVAMRLRIQGREYVLALRKPLTEASSAVAQVRRAFLEAAIVALAVALLAAAIFASNVGRRLRALRAAVIGFGIGGRSEDLPDDRVGDEVGDLSRAFAEMAARLRREEEVRREFVATASHELRTPLMSIQGRLELLADQLAKQQPDIEDGRRQLAQARDQVARLARLASDLLDLSRLDTQVELRREPVEMAELARAVASEFSVRAGAQRTPIDLDVEPANAMADPGASARVLRILLDNALRFSAPGDPVEVALRREDGHVILRVHDRGPGVPEPDRERIFERFARGSGTDGEGGFGLGLTIGRGLSELMGGRLELDPSETGSTFVFTLPAADEEASPNEIPT